MQRSGIACDRIAPGFQTTVEADPDFSIRTRRRNPGSVNSTASVVSRRTSRVRYFFEEGTFITIGFAGNKISGFTTSQYLVTPRCAFSG